MRVKQIVNRMTKVQIKQIFNMTPKSSQKKKKNKQKMGQMNLAEPELENNNKKKKNKMEKLGQHVKQIFEWRNLLAKRDV